MLSIQKSFNQDELRRLAMMGRSSESPGIEFCHWEDTMNVMSNGTVMMVYNIEKWNAKDLWKAAGMNADSNSDFHLIDECRQCCALVNVFKLGGIFKSYYVSNIQLSMDGAYIYLGSAAGRTIEDFFIVIRNGLSTEKPFLRSTADAEATVK